MREYDHKKIEDKWTKEWIKSGLYKTEVDSKKPKSYVLDMFPYPSGEGLHVGHPKGYIATDIYSRFKRMTGHAVLHPMGWDAFGLPAEQFALKNKVHPRTAVENNVSRFKEQLSRLGFNYDWSREINTTDPEYYKWTQWIFKQLHKKGLAYESNEPINWCPVDKTGLSNEDLENGKCERCGSPVEKKAIRQWVLKITEYADRMLDDLSLLNWPEHIKESQRNWIGRSEGAEIEFSLSSVLGKDDLKHSIKVFTTRPDTLFGATYLAISAELARKWIEAGWQASVEVREFVETQLSEEKERAFDFKEVVEKKGIYTGVSAVNPGNGTTIPVWIANYVLSGYGTGAIMAVPAHDKRDHDFAKKFQLPIVSVIDPIIEHHDVIGKGERKKKKKIIAVVEFEGKILSIKWKPELGGNLFLGGTIESGEEFNATILRELAEETGYVDAEVVYVSPEVFHYEYYAYSKEQAFSAEIIMAHVRLSSLKQVATTLEENEKGKFIVEWLTKDAARLIANPPHKRAFELLIDDIPYEGSGVLVQSGKFTGTLSEDAKKNIVDSISGKMTRQYRLKEWVFARQRYWGEPFPVVFDSERRPYLVADTELPVLLPDVKSYEPTDTGESPLAGIKDWVEVFGYINDANEFISCKKEEQKAKLFFRETNTMPQWAGSSWYYLRYIDPKNLDVLVDKEKEKEWSPVDFYVGGAEHATRHLIYARFWHKFLFDLGVVSHPEPFLRLQNVGLIQAEDGRKMSKRWGNIINPDDIVDKFGADSLRVYEMFMGPFGQSITWSNNNLIGARRFIERVWRLTEKLTDESDIDEETLVLHHQTIKKVGSDIETFSFNTAIAQMMTYLNHLEKLPSVPSHIYRELLLILAPFAPFIAEELFGELKNSGSIHNETWPAFNPDKIESDRVTIGVQINGKLRDTIHIERNASEDVVKKTALASLIVQKWLGDKEPKKVIYVQGKIVSIVL